MPVVDILNEAIDKILQGDQVGLEALLAAHPEARPDVEPLLEAAQALVIALPTAAPANFVLATRRQVILRAAARRVELQRQPPRRLTFPALRLAPARRLAYAALTMTVVLALFLGSGSVATAQSLPGQPLYGVKRTAEDAPLWVIADVIVRADYLLTLLERRVYEVEVLTQLGRLNEIALTEVRQATERALAAVQAVSPDRSAAQWTRLEQAVAQEARALVHAAESGAVPEVVRAAFAQASEVCATTQTRARETLPTLPPQVGATATPPGQTHTPPGLARTPEPPGQTHTPPGLARTPEPPGQTHTPPGLARTPEAPGQTKTPPGLARTPEPTKTPKPTHTEKPTTTPKPTQTEKPATTPKPTDEPKPTKKPK